jgi:hypothetical protein
LKNNGKGEKNYDHRIDFDKKIQNRYNSKAVVNKVMYYDVCEFLG